MGESMMLAGCGLRKQMNLETKKPRESKYLIYFLRSWLSDNYLVAAMLIS
jgi:hypothetical protein